MRNGLQTYTQAHVFDPFILLTREIWAAFINRGFFAFYAFDKYHEALGVSWVGKENSHKNR